MKKVQACPKCGSKENPWHVFDFERGIEFLGCKGCKAWFEFLPSGELVPTKKRPRGLGTKYVKCPKCGHPIKEFSLKKPYFCTASGGHIFGPPEVLEQIKGRRKNGNPMFG